MHVLEKADAAADGAPSGSMQGQQLPLEMHNTAVDGGRSGQGLRVCGLGENRLTPVFSDCLVLSWHADG
jgi:hypothetical protein